MGSLHWTIEWSVVALTFLSLHADADYMTRILATEGNDVTLPFPHARRCSRGIHVCHFPLIEGGLSQNGDCQSSSCQPIVTCKDHSTFEPSEEFIDRLGVKEDESRLISDVIVNITALDAGIYHYCPSWEVGVKQQALVIIQNSPKHPEIIPQDFAIRGNAYTITCDTKSRSLPVNSGLEMNIRWEGKEGLNDPDIIISGPNLTIRNLTIESNEMNITCSAKEEEGQWTAESEPFVVSVEYGPERVDMTVIETDNDVTKVTCSADCRPPCSLVFIKDNSTVRTDFGRIENKLTSKCGTHYTCIARNMHDSIRHTFELCARTSVPEVKTMFANNVSREYSLKENQALKLFCAVIGRPEPIMTWHVTRGADQSFSLLKSVSFQPAFIANVDSGILHEYWSTYTIYNVQCNQSGRYFCKAANGRGRDEKYVDVTVNCGPTILQSKDSTEVVQLGQALTMDILVMSHSKPIVTCKKNYKSVSSTCLLNITVTSHNKQVNVTSYKAKMKVTSYSTHLNVYVVQLRKDKVEEADEGVYVVMVTNEDGEAREEFTLNVQEVSDASKLGVLSGSIVSVVCVICVAMVIGIYVRKRLLEAKLDVTQGNTVFKSPKSPSRIRLLLKPEVNPSTA